MLALHNEQNNNNSSIHIKDIFEWILIWKNDLILVFKTD